MPFVPALFKQTALFHVTYLDTEIQFEDLDVRNLFLIFRGKKHSFFLTLRLVKKNKTVMGPVCGITKSHMAWLVLRALGMMSLQLKCY